MESEGWCISLDDLEENDNYTVYELCFDKIKDVDGDVICLYRLWNN